MAQFFLQTIWMVPYYALIGATLTVPSPGIIRRTGPRPAGYISLLMTFLAFIHGLVALQATWNQPPQYLMLPWLKVANLDISLPLEISSITVGATVLVTGMILLAQIYAVGYMEMDWGWTHFYALLALFECGKRVGDLLLLMGVIALLSFGLVALPSFGSFWAFLKLTDALWSTQPWLVRVVLAVNALTAFSLTSIFSLIFGGQTQQMTARSPRLVSIRLLHCQTLPLA